MKDYEKLYKAALVKATREYDSAQTESTKSVIKNIFPELTESNDERIWKEMLDFFCQFDDKTLRGVDISSWIAWLEKQKPVEWSEEDERMLEDCIGAVAAADYYPYEDKQKMENWLKSLKPNHWKPSKEQIDALKQWIVNYRNNGNARYSYPIFSSLYNDLKKL